MPGTMKIFPTQIETFRNCPRKYFYSRDRELRDKYSKASPHLVLGNAVHDALQLFFDISVTPVGERTYERLCDLLRAAWAGSGPFKRNGWKQRQARDEAFGGDRVKEKSWGEKGLNLLYRFFHNKDTDLSVVPLTAEQFHELRLTRDITMGGKIDRIDREPDGSLVVIDYKTGKPPRRADQDEARLKEQDLQLAAYALLVARKFNGRVKRCTYLYLNDELEVTFEPDEAVLERVEREYVEASTRMIEQWELNERGEPCFEPSPNPLCGWCDFTEICKEGSAYLEKRGSGAEQVDLPF